MKLRRSSGGMPDKVDIQMTPMIDIVFQLLIFFLFSFRIVAVEGDFNIRMPLAGTGTPDTESQMAERALPSFAALHDQVMSIVGSDAGPNAAEAANTEVELDCDYNLKYSNVIKAVTAVSGYVTPDGHIVKLIEKIKLSQPKKPD